MNKKSKILILSQNKSIGYYLNALLISKGYKKVYYDKNIKLELKFEKLKKYFKKKLPEYIFFLAGDTGGINKNINKPASLMIQNISLLSSIFELSINFKVKKILYLSSSCIYPKDITNKLKPSMIFNGKPEDSSIHYAVSKLAGTYMTKAIQKEFNLKYISVIPSTIYGPNENFDKSESHVLSSLIAKFYDAKKQNRSFVEIMGTGNPIRDFIHVKDLSNALLFCMQKYDSPIPINISSNESVSIKNLSKKIKNIIGYKGKLFFNDSYLDGMKKKVLDISPILKIGWKPKINLNNGILETYKWYTKNYHKIQNEKK